jgi:hypothetical protein
MLSMTALKQPIEQKNILEQLMEQKGWSYNQLAVEYGKLEHPELSPTELSKKYSTNIRKVVQQPDKARFETVKKLVELLGGELIIRVKRTEDFSL